MLNKPRIFIVIAAFLISVLSNAVLAVSLVDVTVNTRMNERLDGFIELEELNGISAEELEVIIGSQADFDLVGFERLAIVDDIKFELDIQSSSEGLIYFSTTETLEEPYLNLVLNVTWPTGWLMRQYTLLIDLPTFVENAPAITPAAPQTSNGDGSLVVQQGDTLWDIALDNAQESVSVHQMMVGIQELNQNAFINGNINGLRAGAVLRLPTRTELLALNQQQAVEQVVIQNQQFSTDTGFQPITSTSGTVGSANQNQEDELTVLTGNNEGAIDSVNSSIAQLENELALSEENTDRARIENIELESRLTDLEAEIEILQNIIAIEDERIAQLQEELEQQSVMAAQALVEVQAAVVDTESSVESASNEVVDTSFMGKMKAVAKNTWAMIAIFWCAAALIVGFLIWGSRKSDEEEDEFDPSLGSAESALEEDEDLSEEMEALGEFDDDDYDDSKAQTDVEVEEFDTDESDDEEKVDSESEEIDFSPDGFAESEEGLEEDTEEDIDADSEEETELLEPSVELGDELLEEPAVEPESIESEETIEFEEETELDNEILEEDDEDLDFSVDEEDLITPDEVSADINTDINKKANFEPQPVLQGVSSAESEDEELDEPEAETIEFDSAMAEQAPKETIETSFDDAENIEFTKEPESSNAEIALEVESESEPVESLEFTVADTKPSSNEQVSETVPKEVDEVEVLDFSFDAEAQSQADSIDDSSLLQDDDDIESISLDLDGDDDEDFLDLDNIDLDESNDTDESDLEIEFDDEDSDIAESITDNKNNSSTKLDLAVAYESMGDIEGAREIIEEVILEGNEGQVSAAKKLKDEWKDL